MLLWLCSKNSKFCSSYQISKRIKPKEPTLAAEPMIDDPVQGVSPANSNNLSATSRQLVSPTEEPRVFVTGSKVEAMLRKRRKRPLYHRSS